MSIEFEISNFLNKSTRKSENKSRDAEIITCFYGFIDDTWPTLDEVAKRFGLDTRERIRQIINSKFRKLVSAEDLPSVGLFLKLLKSKDYWEVSKLEEAVKQQKLAGGIFSIKGLLNLIKDMGLEAGFELYTPHLKKVTRQLEGQYENKFVISVLHITKLRSLLKGAQALPNKLGIANLDYLKEKELKFYRLITALLKGMDNAWTKTIDEKFWYIFEDRSNVLIGYSEKVFTVIKECTAHRLADCYSNALKARTNKGEYPPPSIIQDYLESSIYFQNDGENIFFVKELSKLNDIEKDAVQYLVEHDIVTAPEFAKFLVNKGYSTAYANKTIYQSPLIFVDKSKGKKQYTYQLINSPDAKGESGLSDRYNLFYSRLHSIGKGGTDVTVKTKKRVEQVLLRNWIFEGKEQEVCAICGNNYSTKSLVTAHKKKRSNCNPAERLDPNIVMPLCLMGCDYLFENMHVIINEGRVEKGVIVQNEGDEVKVIEHLVGRKLNEEWLKGPMHYFRSPQK